MRDMKRIGKRIASIGLATVVTASTIMGGHVYKAYAYWQNSTNVLPNGDDVIEVIYGSESDYGAILEENEIVGTNQARRTYPGIGEIAVYDNARLRVGIGVSVAYGEDGFEPDKITLHDAGELESLFGSSLTIPSVTGDAASTINNNGNLKVTNGFTNAGTLNNSGTFETASFTCTAGTIVNSGTIKANTIMLNGSNVNCDASTGDIELTGTGSSLQLSGFEGKEYPGKIIVKNGSTIDSDGGTFTVKVVDDSGNTIADNLTMSGEQSGYAFDLFKPTVSIHIVNADGDTLVDGDALYIGTDASISVEVRDPNGNVVANPNVTLKRKVDSVGAAYEDWTPASTGPDSLAFAISDPYDYSVQAVVAAEDGKYINGSATFNYMVSYLPLSEVPKVNDADYLGTTIIQGQDDWVLEDIVLTPSSGFLVNCTSNSSDNEDGPTYTETKLFSEAISNNTDSLYSLKRVSDGAYTRGYGIDELVRSVRLRDFYFDYYDPEVSAATLDEGSVRLTTGSALVGRKLSVVIRDEYLDHVIIDGTTYDDATFEEDDDGRYMSYTFVAQPGTVDHAIIAVDAAGREKVIKFSFTKSKDDATAAISVPDTVYGSAIKPVLTSDSDGKEKVVYTYKPADAGEDAYTTEVPKNVGEYSIRATIPETDIYKQVVVESTFKITKATPTISLTMNNLYIGTALQPTISTNAEAVAEAQYLYKVTGTGDETYCSESPTEPGDYTVKVTIPESGNFNAVSGTVDFHAQYLETPQVTYEVSATKGKNNFYTSDIYLIAPNGYEITESLSATFASRLLYHEKLTSYRLRRVSDGALTDCIVLGETYDIDKLAPVVGSAIDQDGDTLTIRYNAKYYADVLNLVIDDENLEYAIVNGKRIEFKDQSAKIELKADGGKTEYVIQLVDLAGNKSEIKFTLLACWMQTFSIPSGSKVVLSSGQSYKLESGRWILEGDNTVYTGGGNFYVKSEGEYTFKKEK